MLVNGARQIGKSYLIRYVSQQLFAHYIEINLQEYKEGVRTIANVHSVLLENKKKRIVYRNIEYNKNKCYEHYEEEFEYLTDSGVAMAVRAISNPHSPLKESEQKSLPLSSITPDCERRNTDYIY